MLKEKRINYAIGIIMGILILSFMAVPYMGDVTCYEVLDFLPIMKLLNEYDPHITAICTFIIITIIAVSLLMTLAMTGLVLRCTKYKQSKAENIVSTIYSSMLFVVIATTATLLILCLILIFKQDIDIKYGYIVLFAVIYLFPYFCATKFNLIFAIYMTVLITYIGIIFYILHEKVFIPLYKKSDSTV